MLDKPTSYFSQGMARFGDVVRNDRLVELCVNPDGQVWIEMQGDHAMRSVGQRLTENEMGDLARNIASAGNSTYGAKKPIISGSVIYEDRPVRFQVVGPPAVSRGHAISMRFFSTLPLDEIELKFLHGAEHSTEKVRQERAAELRGIVAAGDVEGACRFCIAHRLNMIVSGGTSTGKTVLARKLLSYVDPCERMVTIEEAAELLPPQPNVVTLLSDRDDPARSTDALLTSTLRMRPDRLIVGEVRGAEAMTFLEAINTGHGGSMTTLHAETPQLAVARLAIMALKSELPMTYQDMLAYIQGSIDVIVQVGRENGERGITEFFLPTPITEGEAR